LPKAIPTLLLFCSFASLQAFSQSLRYPQAAPFTGLGAYSYHFIDVFSGMANQAALARLPGAAGGIYAERRFMQEKLTNYQAVIGVPAGRGGWGVAARYMGSAEYSESQLGIGYGMQLGKVDIGVQTSYAMVRAAGYGSDGTVVVELGSIWHVTNQVHLGVHVFNPYGGRYGKQGREKIAWIYKAGAGYEVSEKVLLSADVLKEEDKPVNVLAGLQYIIANRLLIRAGIATATATPWTGAGWTLKNMRVEVTGQYHPQLGFTPGLLLIFNTGKERSE